MKHLLGIALLLTVALAAPAQRSAKRGMGWDEAVLPLQAAQAELFRPGVSWMYNWGIAPRRPEVYGSDGLVYAPMCWNHLYDETALRAWLDAHPETRYLLGFNEPNFSSQANMTPAQAVAQWPRLETLAEEYGLTLVAPALNFSAERVGDRVWNPYDWLDEFLRLYPGARLDCLCLHCYMNWYSASTWFATEYFYSDLYNPAKTDVYGRYPHLVAFLDAYKAEHGRFPRMMLTEFCAWENDGSISGADFQIDQMTQKVQKLEQSDLVEGYAWFLGNGRADSYPYMSLLETEHTASDLSTLGKVYVYMSAFDTLRYYGAGETVAAKDYVEATTDECVVRLRPNSDSSSSLPLQIELPAGAWTQYQIEVPRAGEYIFSLRMSAPSELELMLYTESGRHSRLALESTAGAWADRTFAATLPAGRHDVMFYNASQQPFLFNAWSFEHSAGVDAPALLSDRIEVFDLQGRSLDPASLTKGIYVMVTPHGTSKVISN